MFIRTRSAMAKGHGTSCFCMTKGVPPVSDYCLADGSLADGSLADGSLADASLSDASLSDHKVIDSKYLQYSVLVGLRIAEVIAEKIFCCPFF